MKRVILSLLAATLLLAALPLASCAQSDATVIYLVRHAERQEDGTSDPPLSEAGWSRAALLAEMLADAGLTDIYTTDFKRTRGTAQPVADRTGLSMTAYGPRDLSTLASELKAAPGRHLVVGHSNTTPEMVRLLGGDPGSAIDEMEYDRLYIVTLTDDGASTVLLRFGARFGG